MQDAATLLALLQNEDGMSIHKACKKSGLSMSEMMRLLTVLGEDVTVGGLNLVARREDGARTLLFLTEDGRAVAGTKKDER